MRIIACPTCHQLKAVTAPCRHCADVAAVFTKLHTPGAGRKVVYPFAALKKLPKAQRRLVSQAITKARRAD